MNSNRNVNELNDISSESEDEKMHERASTPIPRNNFNQITESC